MPKKHPLVGSAASALLHCVLAIILLMIAVPDSVQQRVGATLLYLPTMARPVTTPQLFKRIIVPKFAPPKPVSMPLPHPVDAEPVSPEASLLPLTLSLPSLSVIPSPSKPLPKPEIRTGGFESVLVGQPIVVAAGFQPAFSPEDAPARPLIAHAPVERGAFDDGAETVAVPVQRKEIASTQFDAVAVKSAPGASKPHTSMRSPLEITSKPRPLYTEEARRLRIEGEVLLQVIFRASSEICVLRVIRGLGHGLDENAIAAAAAIRFRPATEGGRPIDDTATVRITFQLAD